MLDQAESLIQTVRIPQQSTGLDSSRVVAEQPTAVLESRAQLDCASVTAGSVQETFLASVKGTGPVAAQSYTAGAHGLA
jgi:hypothetical protein